jgi:hypothetical protein
MDSRVFWSNGRSGRQEIQALYISCTFPILMMEAETVSETLDRTINLFSHGLYTLRGSSEMSSHVFLNWEQRICLLVDNCN